MIDKSRNHHETNVHSLIKVHSLHTSTKDRSISDWLGKLPVVHVRARRSSLAKWRAVVVGGPLYNISPETIDDDRADPKRTDRTRIWIYLPRACRRLFGFPPPQLFSDSFVRRYRVSGGWGVDCSVPVHFHVWFVQKVTLSEANLSVCLATKNPQPFNNTSRISLDASADWAFGKSSSSINAPFSYSLGIPCTHLLETDSEPASTEFSFVCKRDY